MPSTFLDLLTVIGPCHTSLFSKPNISMMPMSPEAPLVNWKLPSRLGVDGGVITDKISNKIENKLKLITKGKHQIFYAKKVISLM